MAIRAIRQFCWIDILLLMILGNLIGLVLVATKTGIFLVNINVAYLAFQFPALTMIEWKRVLTHLCWRPCIRSVAVLAVQAKKAGVNFRFRMTLYALRWRSPEDLIGMAGFALNLAVLAREGKASRMIEITQTVDAVVTIQAVWPKLIQMVLHKSG
jgi:hypothetical protein